MDDKLLGEKLHYYCSSSEDEDDDDKGQQEQAEGGASNSPPPANKHNTGPKGVMEDWRRYKQLETEKRDEQELERLELSKRLALTCRSEREDKEAEEKVDAEIEAMMDDEFLHSYMQKRMREMMEAANCANTKTIFGTVINLTNGDEFLEAVDNEDHKNVIIVVHIWETSVPSCIAVDGCLQSIAKDYCHVKFCRIQASAAGLSRHFKASGVPAILAYKGGDVFATFVRLTDTFGEDFYANDLESFLIEHGVLADKTLTPSIIRGGTQNTEGQDDSD